MIRLLGAVAATLISTPLPAGDARIAIIIDDLGYRAADGARAVELPGPVAVAVLPDAPLAATLARAAHAAGKQVLVHLPLQAVRDDGLDEPGSIMLDTTRRGFTEAFRRAVLAVPHASGVNNHRGSLLTRHPGHMRWLMEEIGGQPTWFFVDSYTTHHSVALAIAREHGIPAARRDVFLDSHRDRASIEREFERLKRVARERGSAIGIGHPFPETLAVLEAVLPRLEAEGIELVAPGELLDGDAGPTEYRARLTPARLVAQP